MAWANLEIALARPRIEKNDGFGYNFGHYCDSSAQRCGLRGLSGAVSFGFWGKKAAAALRAESQVTTCLFLVDLLFKAQACSRCKPSPVKKPA